MGWTNGSILRHDLGIEANISWIYLKQSKIDSPSSIVVFNCQKLFWNMLIFVLEQIVSMVYPNWYIYGQLKVWF